MARTPRNPIPAEAAERLLDDLAPLGHITKRAMFGGYGLFTDAGMFAIIDTQGTGYFRADGSSTSRYEAAGSHRHGSMPYWQIPTSVRHSEAELLDWASKAISTSSRSKKR